MLEAIKVLGVHESSKKDQDVDQFIEEAKLKKCQKVVCIVFKKDGENITYNRAYVEDYNSSKSRKYLYKTTQHKRYDVTPTARIKKITKGEGKEKTVDINGVAESAMKRLHLWFSTYESKYSLIYLLKMELENKKTNILKDFAKKYQELKVDKTNRIDEQANSILTIKIIENGEEKYLGDFDVFKNILVEEAEKKFSYRKSFGESESKGNGFCCVCKKKGEVLGYALPFSFYTVDKRGFAPKFVREDSWKRLPICKECAKHLTIGKEFLDTYLQKRFYHGYRFYVIPNFILGEPDQDLINEIEGQKRREEYGGLLIEDDHFLEPLKERGGILNLIFMFIEPKQGGNFDIARYIEDVPPSWLKKLDKALQEINNLPMFREGSLKKMGVVGKKKSGDLKNITNTTVGGLVEAFFPKSKQTGVYRQYFINIVGDILARKPINRDLLINAFMREIRNKHVNGGDWNEKILVLKSLMLLLFLNRLNLIRE